MKAKIRNFSIHSLEDNQMKANQRSSFIRLSKKLKRKSKWKQKREVFSFIR